MSPMIVAEPEIRPCALNVQETWPERASIARKVPS
jgi:hypothetical protein